MLDLDDFQKLLIRDVALEYNWNDSDSDCYDGDSEDFLEKFDNILDLKTKTDKNN